MIIFSILQIKSKLFLRVRVYFHKDQDESNSSTYYLLLESQKYENTNTEISFTQVMY